MADLAELMETLARPGLLGLVGKRIEKRCQQNLEAYFSSLGRRIVGLELEKLADQENVEIVKHAVLMKLSNVLRVFSPLLQNTLSINIYEAMMRTDKLSVLGESISHVPGPPFPPFGPGDDQGNSIDKLGLSGEEAAAYATERAAQLVTGINDTTRTMIADTIGQGITDQLGVDGTGRLIRSLVSDISVTRSKVIASTEMNDAMSEAALRKIKRLGFEFKQWILSPDACPICEENEDAVIPAGDIFPSGDFRPPAHPNCRCAVSGARPPETA